MPSLTAAACPASGSLRQYPSSEARASISSREPSADPASRTARTTLTSERSSESSAGPRNWRWFRLGTAMATLIAPSLWRDWCPSHDLVVVRTVVCLQPPAVAFRMNERCVRAPQEGRVPVNHFQCLEHVIRADDVEHP